jgi:hypothetical protein
MIENQRFIDRRLEGLINDHRTLAAPSLLIAPTSGPTNHSNHHQHHSQRNADDIVWADADQQNNPGQEDDGGADGFHGEGIIFVVRSAEALWISAVWDPF